MKFNIEKFKPKLLKKALAIIFGILFVFILMYFVITNFPEDPKFAWGEVAFIVMFLASILIVARIIKEEKKERQAQKKINEVINNKELLLQKLRSPGIVVGGETREIQKIVDRGEKINMGMNEGGITIDREKIIIPILKVKTKPEKKVVKKKTSKKKKVRVKKN